MPYAYLTVDVFTDAAFGGNPLAVVTDARGLSDARMQQVAAEFGYSETTFLLPPVDPAHTAHVRIFTPTREVPFAGHPNVGTGLVVAWQGSCFERPVTDMLTFEEGAGLVPVAIGRDARGRPDRATLTAPQRLSIGPEAEVAAVAACCSLDTRQIDVGAHPPTAASVGLAFVIARVADRAALTAAKPDIAAFTRHAPAMPAPDILLYTGGDGREADVHARMFAPLDGVIEDPATGSANAALVGLLAQLDPRSDCALSLRIVQGEDMGRPSLLQASARKVFGTVEEILVGGGAVQMMSGTLHLD
ncbi:MAG: PhzF family phenazine biosynthesis protein [Alphaproteobacteria bacterium]